MSSTARNKTLGLVAAEADEASSAKKMVRRRMFFMTVVEVGVGVIAKFILASVGTDPRLLLLGYLSGVLVAKECGGPATGASVSMRAFSASTSGPYID
jgi:hypothetical protein